MKFKTKLSLCKQKAVGDSQQQKLHLKLSKTLDLLFINVFVFHGNVFIYIFILPVCRFAVALFCIAIVLYSHVLPWCQWNSWLWLKCLNIIFSFVYRCPPSLCAHLSQAQKVQMNAIPKDRTVGSLETFSLVMCKACPLSMECYALGKAM